MKFLVVVLVILLSGCVVHVSERDLVKGMPGERVGPGVSQNGDWNVDPVSIQLESDVSLRGAHFSRPKSTTTG